MYEDGFENKKHSFHIYTKVNEQTISPLLVYVLNYYINLTVNCASKGNLIRVNSYFMILLSFKKEQ